MNTPICDFIKKYSDSDTVRFHMPGHKGVGNLGVEAYDITEIHGADVLYSPNGIIAESEENASRLFGTAHTFYSTEGSTLAIKAMLAIIKAQKRDTPPVILAARNVHKAFVYAAALLDLTVEWIYPTEASHLCECRLSPEDIRAAIDALPAPPDAVYLTSPDYLGSLADVEGISRVCDEYGIPLLVDNAHGAYLAFLEPSLHPIALGAAMSADSAHKTLPVLTGGAYLHISKKYESYTLGAREALSLFASTSPSYLTLASLDRANDYLDCKLARDLSECKQKVAQASERLRESGYTLCGDEPLKLVIKATEKGYTGTALAELLRARGIECEYADGEYLVLMVSPQNTSDELDRLTETLASVPSLSPISYDVVSVIARPKTATSIRDAVLSPSELIPVSEAVGRICASPTVSCPPAVPIVVSGEIIDEAAVRLFKKYGIDRVSVVK